jgi:hypothetical protein
MNSYNYSYNVLINRLEAFAAGHLLIKRFTHGQIDLADMDQDEQYPFMHVVPNNIKPVDGGMQFDFQIIFADIPRDKEVKAEYQREVISDCVRLAQDLISEVKNGLVLFGFDVQLVTPPVIEPFMEEYKNTLTGVTFSLQLEVPWDWSACDIPAVWAVGGSSSGGSGSPIGIVLRTNGVDNAVQNILDLVAGTNITITDNGDGSVTFDASGGGGPQVYVSTEYNTNHITALGNPYVIGDRVWYNGSVYACIANNDAINPTNPTYWTLQAVGYRLRQSPVDWNASSGDYQILNKPTIPAAQVNSDWNASSGLAQILNKPTIPAAQVNSDWNSVSGVSEILNKPTIPAAQVNSDWNAVSGVAQILNKPTIPTPQNLQQVTDIGFETTNSIITQNVFGFQVKTALNQVLAQLKPNGAGTEGVITINSNNGLDPSTNYKRAGINNIDFPTSGTGVFALSVNGVTPNAATGDITISAGSGTVTSVGLTMPSAFNVTGSPVTTSGTLAVTGAGLATQYVRGDGQLANFPTTSGGGSSVSYYLNGSINQGTIGGSTYYQMSKTAIFGAGTDFTRTNAAGNGLIAQFITDVNDPNVLLIPGGNFNLELYFSASSSGGSPSFYVELYKYDGSTFTLLATDVATPEGITNGTTIDAYFTALAVPATVMTLTDRLALRVFVTTSGRTLKLHTENSHLSQVITTLSTGVNAINGITAQVQNLATGTAGTDFAISSAGSTHTFNLPTASAANRGALSSADWSTFNGKQNSIGLTTVGTNLATLPNPSAVRYLRINADNTVSALTLAQIKSDLAISTAILAAAFTNATTGFESVTDLSFAVTANKTYKWRATIAFTTTTGSTFSLTGPASPTFNVYRFTASNTVNTNAVNNQTAYDSGSNQAMGANSLCTADGVIRPTANGTVTVRVRCASIGGLTVRAGSIIEFEEVL